MLMAPLWGAQMSLGDVMQKCQAGAPHAWGRGSHNPANSIFIEERQGPTGGSAVHGGCPQLPVKTSGPSQDPGKG